MEKMEDLTEEEHARSKKKKKKKNQIIKQEKENYLHRVGYNPNSSLKIMVQVFAINRKSANLLV